MSALAVLLGIGTGLGLWLVIRGWRGTPGSQRGRLTGRRVDLTDRSFLLRLSGAVGAGLFVGAITGWVVGALLAAAGAWALPRVLGPDRENTARITRFEAVASWAEMLRDTLSAAAGLEQAILATAALTPDAIRGTITAAADRLREGQRLAPVLRGLGEELADPTADLVLSALVLAAEQRARDLGELLGTLAAAAREHAALRMSIAAGRAQARSEVRITVGVTLTFALGLLLLDRRYLSAYDTAAGQLVLLVVGALFAAGFALTARIARISEPARFLHTDTSSADRAPVGVAGEGAWSS
ncbi:MAG: type II secretion system F family protein [Jatrophihabitantaceae bacterium]